MKTNKQSEKIGIVGGGMLGLSLAYYLAKNGRTVVVVEKNSELGGLAAGFKVGGANLERYYHHWFKSDVHVQELLKELDIYDKLHWYESKVGIFSQGKLYDFSTALSLLSFPKLNILERLRAGIVSFLLQKFRNYHKFENISALDWCRKYYGEKVTAIIWEPLLKGKFGSYFDQVSMSWLWARIFDRSSSRPSALGPEYLGYPDGGFQILIDTLVKKCRQLGVKFLTNVEIKKYRYLPAGKHRLEFIQQGQNKKFDFNKLIATVPAPIFINIFKPQGKFLRSLKKINYLGAICMVLVLKHKFMPYYWLNIVDPKLPFLAVIEHTNYIAANKYQGKHILYVAKYLAVDHTQFTMSDKKLYNLYYQKLAKINPHFKSSWVEEKNLFRTAFAQHIVNKGYQVPAYETDKEGLYFANFCQVYPHDRGTNYAVAQAQDLTRLIINE